VRYIDLETWPRRRHFAFYRHMDDPHFNVCAPLDVTKLRRAVKARGTSFSVAVVYAIGRAANGIEEFRTRIRGDQVVAHDVVHPSTTVMGQGGLFGFCTFHYVEDYAAFAPDAKRRIAAAQREPTLSDDPDRDDYLFMTAIPWVSFTSFKHPIHLSPVDSVPRMAWGKFYPEGNRLQMPVSVQGHHALMDGAHVGRYFEALQSLFHRAEEWIR